LFRGESGERDQFHDPSAVIAGIPNLICAASAAFAAFDALHHGCYHQIAGWSSLVARWAHNPKVGGSNPPPATNPLNNLAKPPKLKSNKYSFSRFLTISTILQMDTANNQGASANIRLRWNYHPDSDLFLIYTAGQRFASLVAASPPQFYENRFAIKFTYSWQP
jgi:hypothetical protein